MKILLSALIFFFSIVNNGTDAKCKLNEDHSLLMSNADKLKRFKQFISKFQLLSYPFIANTGCYEPDKALSVPLDMDNDSIFINYTGPGVSVGMLPDTNKFYAIIYCTAAACYIPDLAVYSKKGKLLSKQQISFGCGAGEGYTCSETLTIKSLKDIVLVNTQEQREFNNQGKEIPENYLKTNDTYHYSIDVQGVIKVVTSHKKQKKP